MAEESTARERRSLEARGSVEDYYPHYVNEDEVEFDYAYWKCRCGWRSESFQHPSMADHFRDGHQKFGRTVDCGLGKCVMVFEDGSEAEVAV